VRIPCVTTAGMPVNSTHPDYDTALPGWTRARDVMAGEDAIKAAGIRYLSKLDSQTDEEYTAYKSRASFFNATARTAEVYLGLIFRRPPFLKMPKDSSALATAMAEFVNDTDMLGSPLATYAKSVVNEIITVGRAGTLIDWDANRPDPQTEWQPQQCRIASGRDNTGCLSRRALLARSSSASA
jgi:hypothetical protein